ncbi:MAG TPA: penicillin acylase family protein, partial [Gemmatimonadales bacterium]|nr:penicillin acylase family protein [Gemmatimonadales bacterium]
GADVRDYYVEAVDDSLNPSSYRVDGVLRPVERRVETYHGPSGELLHTDTMYSTHRGPLLREGARWLSMRWTPFEATHAGDEFLRLDRAGSVSEWMESWRGFVAPAQNGLVADRSGSIAIRSTALYPVRPGARGDELQDGTQSAADWQGYLPLDAYPFSRDPAQGFLASANQQPVDPRVNGRYFGSNWYSPWRAMRINQLLRGDSSVTPQTMRSWQTDPGSARADAFVPELLAAAGRLSAAGRADSATSQAAALLGEWDRRYTRENRRAILFERVMGALTGSVWDELIPLERRNDSAARAVAYPEEMVLLGLLRDSAAAWWDDTRTARVERRDEIVGAALRTGLGSAIRDFGPPESDGWLWSRAHSANLFHLLRLPSLSALGRPVQGGASTLGPSPGRGTHGASWRMVVELGDTVTAWGTYPGGQSGNPASAHYLDRLPLWLAGELSPVLFPRTPEEIPADRLRAVLTLRGGR